MQERKEGCRGRMRLRDTWSIDFQAVTWFPDASRLSLIAIASTKEAGCSVNTGASITAIRGIRTSVMVHPFNTFV